MKYNSIGEQLIAKAQELDPSYKPDKFNDMSEAINIILNNTGGGSAQLYLDILPYITFDDENVVAIDTEMNVVDHKGNEYEVTLLNKHAYIKDVVESHPSTSQILEVVYLLLIELICWLIPVYLLSKKKELK